MKHGIVVLDESLVDETGNLLLLKLDDLLFRN